MQSSMRPGIYVDYRTYPLRPSGGGKTVGIACPAEGAAAGAPPEAVRLDSLAEAEEAFGAGSRMAALAGAVMGNAGCSVLAVPYRAADEAGRRAALELLFSLEEPYCVLCGEADAGALHCGRDLAAAQGGKLFFAAVPEGADAKALAGSLNCERVVLSAPALRGAEGVDVSAAVLAAMAARSAGSNLFYEEVLGDYSLAAPCTEAEIDGLLRAGVTVLEEGPVCPRVVRCVTTRTKDQEGKPDASMRNLSAVTALDEVVASLKRALAARFEAGGGRLTLEAVRSLVECELLALQDEGLLSGYEKPLVERSADDPSVCRVSVGLQIVQGVVQILLLASVGV